MKRFLPFWYQEICPAIRSGKKIIIVAHGNSLRALVKHLNKISNEEIMRVNIPTGIPLVYELDKKLKPLKHYYLGDPRKVKQAMEIISKQGKTAEAKK